MQLELDSLTKKFKSRENESLETVLIPDNKYLIIRLDGFKTSRNLLKDVVVNKEFHEAFHEAVLTVYFSFRNYLTRKYSTSIINEVMFNDEISFVLNKNNEHEDAKRIMKLCSLFSGMLSAAFTQNFIKNNDTRNIFSFDARPIIVSKDEISKYIRYRYLVAIRYAYWKILRLNNVDDCYEDYIKHNIDKCIELCMKYKFNSIAKKILLTYQMYSPEKTRKPRFIVHKTENLNMEKSKIDSKIEVILEYINKNCNHNA